MKVRGAKAIHYEAGPNMTPLVDVVMVILIFLMLAGSFGGQEHYLVSNLPMSKSGVGAPQQKNDVSIPDPVEIRVDSPTPDKFVASAGGGSIRTSDPKVLAAALTKLHNDLVKAGRKDSDIQVKIAPGKFVKFEHVIAVQDAAMQANFTKIGFVSAH